MKRCAAILLAAASSGCATNDCGALALARAMGPDADVAQLHAETLTPGRNGTLTADMIGAARRHGFRPVAVDSWTALTTELAAGREVIVLQNRRYSWWPQWHYAVVTGFDADTDQVQTAADGTVSLNDFLDTWDDSGYWGLVLTR